MLARVLDRFRGKAITIPPMDGPLRPNNSLEAADEVLSIDAPDNLVAVGDQLLLSSGMRLLRLPASGPATPEMVEEFDSPITALAAAPDGRIAVGLDDGTVRLRDAGSAIATVATGMCPTALAFADTGTLVVCQGAEGLRPSEWARDLMQKGTGGSVWRLDIGSGGKTLLGRGFAFPFGVLVRPERGEVIVAESWRHRLLKLPIDRAALPEPVLSNLPGYPARLAASSDCGAWLSLFAPRNRLIEFVLQEKGYCEDMLREVDPQFWIAPALAPHRSFLEPLQCGAVRTMGIHKPWAPSRSYGLLVRLDASLRPTASFHSRSDGRRHGVMSAVESDGSVFVAAKGGNAILRLDVAEAGSLPQ